MKYPNFLVIGAGRSGTTSLHHYLAQHPDVFLPAVKSPSHFFCRDLDRIPDRRIRAVTRQYFVPDPADYRALFADVRGARAVGEVSPVYLASVRAAERIAASVPHARLIAILRNPVDRAFARFIARRRDGLERRRDFGAVIRDEARKPLVRDVAFDTYVASGFCHRFLATYYARFPRERIRIHLFEDLQHDPGAVMADLFAFLGVDPSFVPILETRHNRSGGTIRNPLLRSLWTGSALARARFGPLLPRAWRDGAFRWFTRDLVAQSLDPGLRADLTQLFRDDVLKLQDLLGRDLSHWLADAAPGPPTPGR